MSGADAFGTRGRAAFPAGPRLAAGVTAILVAGFFLLQAWEFQKDGYPLTAAATPLATLPFALLLLAVALFPASAQRLFSHTRLDLRDSGHVFALLLLTGALLIVFGVGSLVEGAYALERLAVRGEEQDLPALTEEGALSNVAFNLIVFLVPVLVWVVFVGGHRLLEAPRSLGLRREGAGPAFATGIGLTLGVLALMVVVGLLVDRAGVSVPENERALAIARAVSLPAAFLLAAGAALSEEVFFRGFLQPRVGLVPQALLFSVAHLSYANVLQVVVTFALALAYGALFRRTGNLWGPVGAHFSFNFLMLVSIHLASPT